MARYNQNKTISANSKGMIVSYGDANKHQFIGYDRQVSTSFRNVQETKRHIKPFQFSPKQKELFYQVIDGFKCFTKQEVQQMSEKQKMLISVRYTRAQRILRNWKQDVIFTELDNMLLAVFPKSPLIKKFVNVKGHVDVPKEDEITFNEIGITHEQIANKLYDCGLLPRNFYQLT